MSGVSLPSRFAPRVSSRHLVSAIVGAGLGLAGHPAPLAAQAAGAQGYCVVETNDSVVYHTPIFDTKLNPKVSIEARTIGREFNEYLKGRYGFKHASSDYRPVCGVAPTVGAAEAAKGGALARAPETSKRVEVSWNYLPDTAWVTASLTFVRDQGGYGSTPPRASTDYGYCFSQASGGDLHLSAVFDGRPQVNLAQWQIAYDKFLGPKKSFIGNVSCSNDSHTEAERLVKARSDGARAGGHKVIENGWKPGAPASAPAAPSDPDPEPAPAAAPPAPAPASARDFATKEMPQVMALCGNDRLMSGAFDCNLVARVIYNYRLAHWSAGTEPEPLAQLVAGDKLDCSTCVKQFASMWAASRAQSNGYQLAPAQCVGKRFAESIQAKPQLSRVKEVFEAAMKACPK